MSQAQESGFGSYVCKNLVTNETVTSGIFPDHTFAPFSAPLDPDDYGLRYYNNIECNFELVAPVEMYVYIEFARLSLDEPCTGDFITLSLIGEQERTLCGEPQGLVYDVFESNRAHVIFRSDEAITAEGFSAFFKAFNPGNLDTQATRYLREMPESIGHFSGIFLACSVHVSFTPMPIGNK